MRNLVGREIRSAIRDALPSRWRIPAVFWFHKLTGRLEREVGLVRILKRTGSTSIDVGAHHGIYTYAMARVAGFTVAIEPNPHCTGLLRSYESPSVQVIEAAAGASAGRGILEIPVLNSRVTEDGLGKIITRRASLVNDTSARRLEVSILRIDDLGLNNVSLIKIDVEGFELNVLAGARETIARCHPFLIIEIEDRHGHSEVPMRDRIAEIESKGYVPFFLRRSDGTLERYSSSTPIGTPDTFSYINNFVFFPVVARPRV